MIPFLFGVFGLIVGSFLNVVILRHGERGIAGRSACRNCKKQLRWFDMVPVFSWLVLRDRCRYCRASISIQYPLVEATTGILFAIAAYPGSSGVSDVYPGYIGNLWNFTVLMIPVLVIISLLVAIAAYDIRHTIIPDPWVYTFAALTFLWAFIARPSESWAMLVFAGPVAALPLFALWAISKGRWMGFGDVKLALGIGWLLGFPYGLVAVFFAFILGAAVSVPILLWGKLRSGSGAGLTMKSEVPFGPFLIASTLMVWFAAVYNIPPPFSI